eukprot:15354181-Heterocapsa_arctica.AAC.1
MAAPASAAWPSGGQGCGGLQSLQQLALDLGGCTNLSTVAKLGGRAAGPAALAAAHAGLLWLHQPQQRGRTGGRAAGLAELTGVHAVPRGLRRPQQRGRAGGRAAAPAEPTAARAEPLGVHRPQQRGIGGGSAQHLQSLQQLELSLWECTGLCSQPELSPLECTDLSSVAEVVAALQHLQRLQQLSLDPGGCTGLGSAAEPGSRVAAPEALAAADAGLPWLHQPQQ